MKKLIPFLLFSFFVVLQTKATDLALNDTTFRFKDKMIQVEDSTGQVKVKVFETGTNNETVPYKQVYEGVYTDGKSYEKWTVMEEIGLQLPFLNKMGERHHLRHFKMEPHWAGFGWGFANITDQSYKMNNIDGLSLKAEKSNEWYLNLFEKIVPIYRNNIGITTGLGMNWHRFFLDNNTHLVVVDGITKVEDAPIGINYEYSRLTTMHITIPLLLEFQPTFGSDHKLFASIGVVGGINVFSSNKVKQDDITGHAVVKVEGNSFNTAPLSLDFMGQIGYGGLSVYAKYSPFSIFQEGKGPSTRAVSCGLVLNF